MSSNEQNPAVRKNKIIDRLKLKKLGLVKKSPMYEFQDFYKIGMFSSSYYRPSSLNFQSIKFLGNRAMKRAVTRIRPFKNVS